MFFFSDEYENESLHSTVYSYDSDANSDLDLLRTTAEKYSKPSKDPFEPIRVSPDSSEGEREAEEVQRALLSGPFALTFDEDEIVNDDSGDEAELSKEQCPSSFGSVDPTCLVAPSSAKAYAGVAKHRDFVRQLPVHLAKYILSFLDQVSLFHCVSVSKYWSFIVDEVHKEYFINQHLKEEVLLMQVKHHALLTPLHSFTIFSHNSRML